MENKAKWIFHPSLGGEDLYCDFYDNFTYAKEDGRTLIRLSADYLFATTSFLPQDPVERRIYR